MIEFKGGDALPAEGALVLPVASDGPPSAAFTTLDARSDGALARALASSRFGGGVAEALDLGALARLNRLILLGTGAREDQTAVLDEQLGGRAVAALEAAGIERAAVIAEPADAASVALGASLRAYRFDRHRSRPWAERPTAVTSLTILTGNPAAARRAWAPMLAVAAGVALARDLVNEPPNVLYPAAFVERVQQLAPSGLEINALDEARLRRLGLGALLAVGQGSAHKPYILTLSWKGDHKTAPVALVGKGMTFDAGGISIKPANRMWEMKGDMAGAAGVVGAMAALAGRRAPVNAVAVVALAENMAGAAAYRPGDVLRTLSGKTVEVIDTDAEGRLALADALAYAVEAFKPRALVDVATLTGSIIRALGGRFAGVFASDDDLAAGLIAAGEAVDERLWRMPLDPYYDENLESPIADLRQVAPDDESADAVHGATFLRHFTAGLPWAHIDTGKLTTVEKDTALAPKGATGFGVRLFDRWIADTIER